jgi:hypothetical protein
MQFNESGFLQRHHRDVLLSAVSLGHFASEQDSFSLWSLVTLGASTCAVSSKDFSYVDVVRRRDCIRYGTELQQPCKLFCVAYSCDCDRYFFFLSSSPFSLVYILPHFLVSLFLSFVSYSRLLMVYGMYEEKNEHKSLFLLYQSVLLFVFATRHIIGVRSGM